MPRRYSLGVEVGYHGLLGGRAHGRQTRQLVLACKPALDARPHLGVRLARRVADGLLERAVLALLAVPGGGMGGGGSGCSIEGFRVLGTKAFSRGTWRRHGGEGGRCRVGFGVSWGRPGARRGVRV